MFGLAAALYYILFNELKMNIIEKATKMFRPLIAEYPHDLFNFLHHPVPQKQRTEIKDYGDVLIKII